MVIAGILLSVTFAALTVAAITGLLLFSFTRFPVMIPPFDSV
jgi:hypothetical protein